MRMTVGCVWVWVLVWMCLEVASFQVLEVIAEGVVVRPVVSARVSRAPCLVDFGGVVRVIVIMS